MRNLDKNIVITAAILAAVTIGLGAFGAHGLKQMIDAKSIGVFETAVKYQMYHVLAIFVLGFANPVRSATKKWTFRYFIFGIIFFSGSLYVLSLNELFSFDASIFAFITPIGGLFFIIGWLRLAYGVYTLKSA